LDAESANCVLFIVFGFEFKNVYAQDIAKNILRVVLDFVEENRDSSIRFIKIVDPDPDFIKEVSKQIKYWDTFPVNFDQKGVFEIPPEPFYGTIHSKKKDIRILILNEPKIETMGYL
jgi:hypothetical protein